MIVLAAVLQGAVAVGILQLSTFAVYVYRDYGEAILGGSVPYRDFAVESPPGSLALFVPTGFVSSDLDTYQLAFANGMLLAAAVGVLLALIADRRQEHGRVELHGDRCSERQCREERTGPVEGRKTSFASLLLESRRTAPSARSSRST